MTGQVKEDILSRLGELGAFVIDGKIQFHPDLLRKTEFLKEATSFDYVDVSGNSTTEALNEGSMAFTYCQVPIIYQLAEKEYISVKYKNGKVEQSDGLSLDRTTSDLIFNRSGEVQSVTAGIKQEQLK